MTVNGNILTDTKENSMFSFITNLFKPKPKPLKKSRLLTMTKRELETLGRNILKMTWLNNFGHTLTENNNV